MGDFRQRGGNRFGGSHGGGFGGRDSSRSGGRDRGPVTMHQAICSQCGKPCEVPFQPTSGKPVYCSECFETKRDSEGTSGGGRFPQKSFNRYESPARTSFGGGADKGSGDEVKKQLELLNTKMDQLITAIGAMKDAHSVITKEKVEEKIQKMPVVKIKKATKTVVKKAKK